MVLVNYNIPDLKKAMEKDKTFEISLILRLEPPSEDREAETHIFCAK